MSEKEVAVARAIRVCQFCRNKRATKVCMKVADALVTTICLMIPIYPRVHHVTIQRDAREGEIDCR